MAGKTVFEHGSYITPEFMNALQNPSYVANPQNDGEFPIPPQIAAEASRAVLAETGIMTALDAESSRITGVITRLDKAATFYQEYIPSLAPVAMTSMVQSILESDDLPIGSYVVSANAIANLPAGGFSDLIIRAGVYPAAGELPDESFGNHLQWTGSMMFRKFALQVTPRVISLSEPGKIHLNCQCTNFGPTIAGNWTGSLLVIPLPT